MSTQICLLLVSSNAGFRLMDASCGDKQQCWLLRRLVEQGQQDPRQEHERPDGRGGVSWMSSNGLILHWFVTTSSRSVFFLLSECFWWFVISDTAC